MQDSKSRLVLEPLQAHRFRPEVSSIRCLEVLILPFIITHRLHPFLQPSSLSFPPSFFLHIFLQPENLPSASQVLL